MSLKTVTVDQFGDVADGEVVVAIDIITDEHKCLYFLKKYLSLWALC